MKSGSNVKPSRASRQSTLDIAQAGRLAHSRSGGGGPRPLSSPLSCLSSASLSPELALHWKACRSVVAGVMAVKRDGGQGLPKRPREPPTSPDSNPPLLALPLPLPLFLLLLLLLLGHPRLEKATCQPLLQGLGKMPVVGTSRGETMKAS